MTPHQFIDDRWRVIRDIAEAEGRPTEWEEAKYWLEWAEQELGKCDNHLRNPADGRDVKRWAHRRDRVRMFLETMDEILSERAAERDIPLTTDGVTA